MKSTKLITRPTLAARSSEFGFANYEVEEVK